MSRRLPPPEDWHPEDVKAALRKRGITLTALSRQHGYSTNCVGAVLRRPAATVQEVIAAALELDPRNIWPSRYNPDGSPRRRNQRRADRPAAQRQNGKAR